MGKGMDRRIFLKTFTASTLTPTYFSMGQERSGATLTIGEATKVHVPEDFVGLSYESAQLANPEFFSRKNKQLIHLFHELAFKGNLRLGGGSSEFTTYSETPPLSPPPFEVFGPDTSKTIKYGTIISTLALRNLRQFLDETGWNCLYGLNLGQGTVKNAVNEAAAVQAILGPRLLAFQIGNEPDSFRNRYRPATYTPADYIAEWRRFHDAVVKEIPKARFAGPDISNKLAYLTTFAEEVSQYPDVILLTSHYYAMGPASNSQATLENLLSPDPKLATLKSRDLPVVEAALKQAHLPYRMSEGNSCWDGGKPEVSDTFAAALWCADYMLTCMKRGWAGVNLHGGGNGYYTPIAGSLLTGLVRRPEFFGLRFARRFVGAKLIEAQLHNADPRVNAFVFEKNGKRELVLINKTSGSVHCDLPSKTVATPFLALHAPAIDAKDGVQISLIQESLQPYTEVPAYTARVFRMQKREMDHQ